jgi:uncharacterized protein (TIGR02118 family)
MLKACTFFSYLDGMSNEDGQKYWRTSHADIVSKVSAIKKYVQCHPIIGYGENSTFEYDGYAELYVDDSAALKVMNQTPEFADVIADEKEFINSKSVRLILADEIILKGNYPDKSNKFVKLVRLFTAPKGISPENFRDLWLNNKALSHENSDGLVARFCSFARLSGYKDGRTPIYDLILSDYFLSTQACEDYLLNSTKNDVVGEQVSSNFVTKEIVVIA